MIKVMLTNEVLQAIAEIERNRGVVSSTTITKPTLARLRKNSKKKSSFASNKIEGNPLTEEQADSAIEEEGRHFMKPEQEVRNYFLALNFLEDCLKSKVPFSKELILDVQKLVVKGSAKEKIGLRGAMPPGVLFAVYDSDTKKADYIPPEAKDISPLLDELIDYVLTTKDNPLIVAAIVHYQLVTIHPFEDGNGRTARLLSGYILDYHGYGFGGIGSLEEYFAYDIDEYYKSLQMGLPPLYYDGRDNPPHPEIWINYFLRMVALYSSKVAEISKSGGADGVAESLSHLKEKEKKLLLLILKRKLQSVTPIELSRLENASNRTVINRLAKLVQAGFAEPILVKQRVTSYKLTDFATKNREKIIKCISREN